MSNLAYRPDIDGLRALAVLSVVVFHVNPRLLSGGYLGVDIFFVISGYLIALLLFREQGDGSFSFANFYMRRVRRLFPALFVVLLSSLLFGAFSLFADEYERLGNHTFYAISFLLNFNLISEAGYFDVTSNAKPLLHLWSLSIEEQFYLLWPLLLVMIHKLRLNRLFVLVAFWSISCLFAIYLTKTNLNALYYHPVARFWELLIGVALAYWHYKCGEAIFFPKLDSAMVRNIFSLVGLFLVVGSLLIFNGKEPFYMLAALVPLLGVAAIIASGSGTIVGRMLSTRGMVFVGLISYPLYLWHWPLLSYIRIMESGNPPEWLLWCAAGIALLLAWLTFRLVERPIRHKKKNGRIAALVCAMLVLVVASRLVVAMDGFPHRPAIDYVQGIKKQMQREPEQNASCLQLFGNGDAPVYCRQNETGRKMIAIIGDSHAHVIFPGLAAAAAKKGYGTILLANSSCPPFIGAVTGRNNKEKNQCNSDIERILRAVEMDKRIVAVVIASRGPIYLAGKGFGPAEADYNYPPISSSRLESSVNAAPRKVFADGLIATVNRLHRGDLPIAYVLQVPEMGVPAQDLLNRPLTLTSRKHGYTVPYQEYHARMSEYREMIWHDVYPSLSFLRIVDAQPLFCRADYCSGFHEEQLFYADDDHLSILGSMMLAPLIMEALNLAGVPTMFF